MEFLYKAYADSGEVEEGRVTAAGKREAADVLRNHDGFAYKVWIEYKRMECKVSK